MKLSTIGRSRISALAVLALLLGAVGAAQADSETMTLSYSGYRTSETNIANSSVVGMYWWDNTPDANVNSFDVWTFCIEPGDWIEDNPQNEFYTFYKIPVAGMDEKVLKALYPNTWNTVSFNQKGADIKELWLENVDTMFNSVSDVGTGNYTAEDAGDAAASLQAAIWHVTGLGPHNDWNTKWNAQSLLNGLNQQLDELAFDDFNEVYALIAEDSAQQNQAVVGFSVNPAPINPVPLPAAAWPCIGMLAGVVGWKKYRNRKLEV